MAWAARRCCRARRPRSNASTAAATKKATTSSSSAKSSAAAGARAPRRCCSTAGATTPSTPSEPSMAAPRFVDDYLGYLLGQANHALYKEFDAHVRAAGLSSIEWRVLATLHDAEPLTISQLAHEVLSKQPTVTKLVQRMAEQGWLALQADANDQRRTLVLATP